MYMRDILDCDLAAGFFDPGSYTESEILGKGKKESSFSAAADTADRKGKACPGRRSGRKREPKLIALTRSRIFTKGIRHIKLKLAFYVSDEVFESV